jgi:hypothetical protein
MYIYMYNNRSQKCNYVMKPERVCVWACGGSGRQNETDCTYPFKAALKWIANPVQNTPSVPAERSVLSTKATIFGSLSTTKFHLIKLSFYVRISSLINSLGFPLVLYTCWPHTFCARHTLLLTDSQNNKPKLKSLTIWRLTFSWMLYKNSIPNSQEV